MAFANYIAAVATVERTTIISPQELGLLSALINDAAESGAAILSVLEPPPDEERAIRVACPFDEPDKLPIPLGNLSVIFKNFKRAPVL
jgi:hypothetical protein